MIREKDPMGMAIADYHKHGVAGRLRVFSPDFEEDEIPVETLFRDMQDMPALEQKALELSTGKTLDVGAGAGCHSLVLQGMNVDVTAIDISPLSVETMKERGVRNALEKDFWTITESYDTILMLMNGIGIVGSLDELPRFFKHISKILKPDGQLIFDSSDISYLFENEDGIIELPDTSYYGELIYQMQYKRTKGSEFKWLYVDYQTIKSIAEANGFDCLLLAQGEHFDYLAQIKRR